jgi:hypothetical protein
VEERRPVIAATFPERSFEGAFAACATSNPDFGQKSTNFGRLKSTQIPICIVFDHF